MQELRGKQASSALYPGDSAAGVAIVPRRQHWCAAWRQIWPCLVGGMALSCAVGWFLATRPAYALSPPPLAFPLVQRQIQPGSDAAPPAVQSLFESEDLPPLKTREQLLREATDNPQTIFEQAPMWQRFRGSMPEEILKSAVQAAFKPDATWSQAEAAIRAFNLYADQSWVKEVITPFVSAHAADMLLNLPWLVSQHQGWAHLATEIVASRFPVMTLEALSEFVALDPLWAQDVVNIIATTAPGTLLSYADVLLTIDSGWAQALISQVASAFPQEVIEHIGKFATPWGQKLFDNAAIEQPFWAVGMASPNLDTSQAVLMALQQSTVPAVQVLAQIATSDHPEPVKGRLVVFMWRLSDNRLSFEEAVRLCLDEQAYFRQLTEMKFAGQAEEEVMVETMLKDAAIELTERLNELHDEPDAVRFRVVTPFTPEMLYLLIAYGESVMYTSSYLGLFERLSTRMKREKLTGDQLLMRAQDVRFRAFIRAAATFNRLDAFMATMSSPVEGWALLTRCMSNIDRSADRAEQAVTAAGILGAIHDTPSLRLIRDTITNEYQRAQHEQSQEASIIYGLLAAQLHTRLKPELHDPSLETIASAYAAHIPDLTTVPIEHLFVNGVNVQRHFFYNDKDGKDSFTSFTNQYRHTKMWQIDERETMVVITSATSDRHIVIYANKPEYDAQPNDVDQFLRDQGLTPQVIVHRGHSYHVMYTIDTIPPVAALVFLGNCGSYNQLEAVLAKAPRAHIITTQGIGSLTVNDPLLKALNEHLLRAQELHWSAFWSRVTSRLAPNPRFADYLSPDQNAGLIFLKAYRHLTAQ